MGKLEKNILKHEAKKIYEQNARKVPKKSRIPFSQFFKQYMKLRKEKTAEPAPEKLPETNTDFDFSEMVNVNDGLNTEQPKSDEIIDAVIEEIETKPTEIIEENKIEK